MNPAWVVEPGMRCTAFYYVTRRGLPATMCYLQELGLRAARLARQYGQATARVTEGPFWVHTWEQWFWDAAAASMEIYRTAWEYAGLFRMLAGDGSDIEFTRSMACYAGELAARLAVPLRLAGYGPPELSQALPDWVWARVTEAMAANSAAGGDWHLYDIDLDALVWAGLGVAAERTVRADPEHPHGYQYAGDYDDVTAYPGPQGTQAGYDIGY